MTLPESITDNGVADRNFRALDATVAAIPPQTISSPSQTLKVLRGVITTTTPTIVVGVGFTIARNGVGDVTVTFTTAFSAAPAVLVSPDASVLGTIASVKTYAAGSTQVTLYDTTAKAATEGTIHFLAIGP